MRVFVLPLAIDKYIFCRLYFIICFNNRYCSNTIPIVFIGVYPYDSKYLPIFQPLSLISYFFNINCLTASIGYKPNGRFNWSLFIFNQFAEPQPIECMYFFPPCIQRFFEVILPRPFHCNHLICAEDHLNSDQKNSADIFSLPFFF